MKTHLGLPKNTDPFGSSKKYRPKWVFQKIQRAVWIFNIIYIKNTITYNIKLYVIDKDKISTKPTSFYEKL